MAHTPHSTPASKRHLGTIRDVLNGKKSSQEIREDLLSEQDTIAQLAGMRIPDHKNKGRKPNFTTFAEHSLPPEKDD